MIRVPLSGSVQMPDTSATWATVTGSTGTLDKLCSGLVGTWTCPNFYDGTITITPDYRNTWTAQITTESIDVCGCFRSRTRTVLRQPFGTGQKCPNLVEHESCQHCEVSSLSGWSVCVDGNQNRTRTVTMPKIGGGRPCPELSEKRNCVDCSTTTWGAWSSCSSSTNQATRTRTQTESSRNTPNTNPCELVQVEACSNCEVGPYHSKLKHDSTIIETDSGTTWSDIPCIAGSKGRTRSITKASA
jgi:hypothetical protein